MDRRRALSPVYTRQYSTASSNDSPSASPAHPHAHAHSRHASIGGAGGFSTVRRTQNHAAKQAAQRLAQVMANQTTTDDDGDDDDGDDLFGPPPSLVPPISRRRVNGTAGTGSGSGSGNAAAAVNGFHGRTNRAPSPAPTIGRPFVEPVLPGRSISTGRPTRPATVAPPALKTPVIPPPVELPTPKTRPQGRFPEFGQFDSKVSGNEPEEAADLLDKLDLLQQENETFLEQFREAEKKREEAEARVKQLELQVASMGEGLSLEGKLIKRKEAALRQREAALAAAKRRSEGKEEIEILQSEIETLRTEAATIVDKLHDAETEAKSLRIMTQRMILTKEEEEEVMLKRCWLARYWGLAVQYGICADIAGSKYEHWSRFAPLPFEVVTSAGQKAKEDFLDKENSTDKWSKPGRAQGDLTGEGNVETMLSVEMGLREMASLKIEDAIALSMAQRRRPNLIRDQKVAADPKFMESFELSQEESDDVLFKEAWLAYFWKRAKDYRVEEDIAEERVQLWTTRAGQSPTLQDAVDVDRGLIELRKLGIEQQLWEASRKELEHHPSLIGDDNDKDDADSENSS